MTEVLMICFVILAAIICFWALYDLSQSNFKANDSKFLWFAVVLVFPVLGALLYFQFSREFRKEKKIFRPDFHRTEQL